MRWARYLFSSLVAATVLGVSWTAGADDELPCSGKNHFILREPCLLEMRLSWATAAPPPFVFGEGHATTLLDDGRVLVVGGVGNVYDERTRGWNAVSGAAIYDPARDAWSPAGT